MSTHSMNKPKLQVTKDYGMFEMHELNRDMSEHPALLESMKHHGFMPSSPIQCVRNGRGTLKVIRGHHRLDYAKRLGLAVWYVIDDTNTNIWELEGDSSSSWSIVDFLIARAKAGDENCQKVIAFKKRHGLTQGAAISLLGGEGAGSGNQMKKVKVGTYRVSDNLKHAEAVAGVVDFCKGCGIDFATQSAFVAAVSMVLRIPEFDAEIFQHRISRNPSLLQRQTNSKDYLRIIEDAYNYGAKGRSLSVKLRAIEIGRQRQKTFGENTALARKLSFKNRHRA